MRVYRALKIIPSDKYLMNPENKPFKTEGNKVRYMLINGLRENGEWESLGMYDTIGLLKTDEGFSHIINPLRIQIIEKDKKIMFELFTYETHRIVLKESIVRFEFDVMKKEDVILESL